jgi:hypothetical protein
MLNAFGVFAVFFPFLAVYGHEDNTLCGPIPEKASRAPFWANLTIADYASTWIDRQRYGTILLWTIYFMSDPAATARGGRAETDEVFFCVHTDIPMGKQRFRVADQGSCFDDPGRVWSGESPPVLGFALAGWHLSNAPRP